MSNALAKLREATNGTKYDGTLWLVGGFMRDKLLGLPGKSDDVDIVLEDDAAQLAVFLENAGLSQHAPVVYPRFGTAMVTVAGVNVELVTARRESYEEGSRKPSQVEPASIADDARRRDFTINTLLENLHTGERVDPLGCGRHDLAAGIIRTPLPPEDTFADDPLRMLRAIRFAARFHFMIEPDTWKAIVKTAPMLIPTVSGERIRDEFNKILLGKDPTIGLELLRDSGLLHEFAPELVEMVGVDQNEFHHLTVWDHTLLALTNLVQREEESPLLLRLAVLMHDCGKPATKSVGSDGRVHFYAHQDVGASITQLFMTRLKFARSDISIVTKLVAQHMRIGEYKPDEWTDAAVRRFIRAAGSDLDWLFAIHRADVSALSEGNRDIARARMLRDRIDKLQSETDSRAMESPLSGAELMALIGIPPGPEVGEIKLQLTDAVIDGRLLQGDKISAGKLALELHQRLSP